MMSASDSLAARRRSRPISSLRWGLGSFAAFWHLFIKVIRFSIIGIFITAVIIIGSGWYFIRAEIARFQNSKIVFISADLDEPKNTITLSLIKDNQLELISFADTLPSMVGTHGEYQLRAVYPLLEQEGYTAHEQSSFFAFIFGTVIDEVISLSSTAETPAELRNHVLRSWQDKQVPLLKALALWWLLYTVDDDSPTVHQITTWDEWQAASEELMPASLLQNCSVAVINSTPQKGLAQAFNQVLEREGVEVIRLASVSETQEKSVLVAVDESCSTVAEKIKKIAPVTLEIQYDAAPEKEYRAKILLMIGKDIGNFNPQLTH